MPTLAYWKIRGLAQPIRLLLNYVGQEFEDVRYEQGDAPEYSREEWLKVKFTLGLPIPNLPYYIEEDIKIVQTNAILKHIARKHDLLGKTPKEQAHVDMMLDQAMDFRNGTVRLAYNPDYEKVKGDYLKELPEKLDVFEKILGENPWFAGNNITVCDFHIYELLDQHKLMFPGCMEKYPKLKAFSERFEALPNIKKYLASDKCIKRPVNNKSAGFK